MRHTHPTHAPTPSAPGINSPLHFFTNPRSNTAGCTASTPAKSCTWCRHDVPAATNTAPGFKDRAAGNNRRSPICFETS